MTDSTAEHAHEAAQFLADRIDEKQREMSYLSDKMKRSLLLQSIWPDAFKHGACKTGGITRYTDHAQSSRDGKHYFRRGTHALVKFWIEDGAGNRYYLNRRELLILKPDEPIHPDYEETTND